MSQIHDFERVMRQVGSATMPARGSERRVIIDVKRGRAVDGVGILDFMREFKYFIVSNSEDRSNEGFGVVNLIHRTRACGDHKIETKVSWKVWCPPGREKQLVEALHHGSDPGEELNGFITKWVVEHLNSNNPLFTSSGAEAKNFIQAAIRSKAHVETGLQMEVDFAVISPPVPPARMSDTFAVHANDYHKEETLTVIIDIATLSGFSAFPYPEPALRELVRLSVQDYFAHNVSLNQIYLALNTHDFNALLTRELNQKLRPTGYRIDSLSLERVHREHDEPYSWMAGIQIEIGELEGTFETLTPNLFVSLSLTLTVQLTDVFGIKPYLERQMHVPEIIQRAVVEVTRQFVRESQPAEIYDHPTHLSGRTEFESRLRARLDDMLSRNFHGSITGAVLKVGETEVTKALAELQKESCEFKVMIPRNRRNSEDCLFRGYFKIDGIERDRWTEFRKTLPCVAQVKERLEAAIKTGLENDPTALISLKHSLSLRHVQEVAEHAARAAALSDFGLKVTITNVGSDDVESEKKLAESVIKGRISSIENELKRYFSVTDLVTQEIQKLEQDIVRIMATGGRDDAIEENRTRIEALRKHLPIDPIVSRLHYENLRDGHSSEKSDKPEREVEMSSAPFAL